MEEYLTLQNILILVIILATLEIVNINNQKKILQRKLNEGTDVDLLESKVKYIAEKSSILISYKRNTDVFRVSAIDEKMVVSSANLDICLEAIISDYRSRKELYNE